MAHTFTLPDLGEGLTEGEIARWLVSEGEVVAENEPIVEIQTDKATVEVGAPVDGVVLRIVVREGEVAAVGAALAVIGATGRAAAVVRRDAACGAAATTGAADQRRRRGHAGGAPPAPARARLAVDFASLQGTGLGGACDRGRRARRRPAGRGTAGAGTGDPAGDRGAGRAHAP